MNVTTRPALCASAVLLLAALAFVGCKQERKTQPEPSPEAVQARQGQPTSAPEARADAECAAPIDLSPPTQLELAGRTATRSGYKLSFAQKDEDGALVLGVLGPVNEDTGANLMTLKKYLQFFKDEKADAILVTGDVGETEAGIARVLEALGEAQLPTFVVIGNRECRADFSNGMSQAQKRFPQLVNLNQVRAVEFPEATLVSLPGYHDADYLHCKQGCQYQKSTVDEVVRVAKDAKGPVVLVAHAPPRGQGSQALDHASGGGNVGDTQVNRAIEEGNISFGVFSNIKEAGARGVDSPDGTTLVAQDTPSKRLFLNPGPADTEGWEMNDGTKSAGMAAVLRLQDGQGSWKLYRGKALTAQERTQAKSLEQTARGAPGETNP